MVRENIDFICNMIPSKRGSVMSLAGNQRATTGLHF